MLLRKSEMTKQQYFAIITMIAKSQIGRDIVDDFRWFVRENFNNGSYRLLNEDQLAITLDFALDWCFQEWREQWFV